MKHKPPLMKQDNTVKIMRVMMLFARYRDRWSFVGFKYPRFTMQDIHPTQRQKYRLVGPVDIPWPNPESDVTVIPEV